MPEASAKQPPPPPAAQFWGSTPKSNCWKSRPSKQRRARFSQSSRGGGDARAVDDRVFAALLCCCTFIHTVPSTSKVRTHGNVLYAWGTPAQTRNSKRGKERKRAVIIGLLRNMGNVKRLSLSHILKKTPNKLRNNAVAHVWLHKHTTVPQMAEVTTEQGAGQPMLPPDWPHQRVFNVLEKNTPCGERGFWEKQG